MFGPVRPTHLDGINSYPSMIGKRVCLYVGPVFLKCQPSGFYQTLDLVLQGNALFDRVAQGSPMVGLYHFGNGDWKILPGVTTTNWLVMRDGKRSLYVIGIGVNS